MEVPELLWHCSIDWEVIGSDIVQKFYWACGDVGETPWIIGKMTDFWRLAFSSIIWSLATLCDTLITFRENHWLVRLIWRFSESVFEYESVFRICVWIRIQKILLSFFWNQNRLGFKEILEIKLLDKQR